MREIKFRAWHKKKKIMRDVFAITITNDYKTVGVYDKDPTWFFNEIELIEFTGLKDKNNKEIYEGDILENREIDIYEVKFGYYDNGFKHEMKQVGNGWYFESSNGRGWALQQHNTYKDCEIIGNIYENKDLLCQSKSTS